MHNKERAVSLEQSNGTCSKMEAIWMLARVGTYILLSRNFAGQLYHGPADLSSTERSLRNLTTVTTLDVSCRRRSGTVKIMGVNLLLFPPKPRSTSNQ